jgi:phage gp29-like protein
MPPVPALVDQYERPLRRPASAAALAAVVASASLTGVRQAWTQQQVASGLTPEKLARIMRAAAEGDHTEYVILAEEMEERDWHYGAALGQRKLAVIGLNRHIDAASEDKLDQDIAAAVREFIIQDECFEDLITGALDALGKGWAAVEIAWNTGGNLWRPESYDWRDPRWFRWDRETGRELRMLDEQDVAFGIPLQPYRFMVHKPQLKMGLPVRGGLARLVAWAFMFKFYAVKDWAAFCETFGQPLRVGKYGPTALKDDIEVLYQAVAMIGTDCAAVIPDSMMIEFVKGAEGAGNGADLYNKICDWLDKQVSKAVLGQGGTTDMQKGGLAQAKVLDEVREDLRDSDAIQLARSIRRDVMMPFVRFNFGPDAKIPGFKLLADEAEDLVKFSAAVGPLIDRGLKVKASEVYDRFGLETPEPGDEVLTAAANPASVPIDASQSANHRAWRGVKAGCSCAPCNMVRSLNRAQTPAQVRAGVADADAIDGLTDPLNAGWREVMDPLVEPIEHLAAKCSSYEEFTAALDDAAGQMDVSPLARALAIALFKARGLGDATDDPHR